MNQTLTETTHRNHMPKLHTHPGQGILPTRSNHTSTHCLVAKKTTGDNSRNKENKFKRKELKILKVLTYFIRFDSIQLNTVQSNAVQSNQSNQTSPFPFPLSPFPSCTPSPPPVSSSSPSIYTILTLTPQIRRTSSSFFSFFFLGWRAGCTAHGDLTEEFSGEEDAFLGLLVGLLVGLEEGGIWGS